MDTDRIEELMNRLEKRFASELYKKEYRRIMQLNGRETTLQNKYLELRKERYNFHREGGRNLFALGKASTNVLSGLSNLKKNKYKDAILDFERACPYLKSAKEDMIKALELDNDVIDILEQLLLINKGIKHNREDVLWLIDKIVSLMEEVMKEIKTAE